MTEGRFMALRYDGTVNAGALLQVVTIVATVAGMGAYIQSDLVRLAENQTRMESAFASEVATIRSEASERAARLRAAELTIAGQTSDLRNIQAGIADIKVSVDRLLQQGMEGRQ